MKELQINRAADVISAALKPQGQLASSFLPIKLV